MRSLLTGYSIRHQCASKLYGLKLGENGLGDDVSDQEEDEEDIEASINREISSLKKPKSKMLIMSIKLDIPCGKSFQVEYSKLAQIVFIVPLSLTPRLSLAFFFS